MSSSTRLWENGKLQLDYLLDQLTLKIKISGAIDEDADFGVLADLLRQLSCSFSRLEFDLSAVTTLNSCGLRDWMMFMERVSQPAIFRSLSEVFVDQCNMISNLLGGEQNRIADFQAPYYCPQCKTDSIQLLEFKDVAFKGEEAVPPARFCPKCKGPLEFDSIPDEYFYFLTKQSGRKSA